MGMVAWGLLLLVIGLAITFSSVLGFLPGVPLMVLGVALAVLGVILWILGLPARAGRAMRSR